MDNVTIIIESAEENEKPDWEFIPKEQPKKEASKKRSLDEDPAPTKRAKVETVPITAPMPEVEEPLISLDFSDDFLLSSQLSCSTSSGSSTVSSVPTYKPTPIQRTTDEVLMGRIEKGLETKLQTNNEAMLCLQATSIEILQQLKDKACWRQRKTNLSLFPYPKITGIKY